jgi:hypothetical protein
MANVFDRLDRFNVHPSTAETALGAARSELLQRIQRRAGQLRYQWYSTEVGAVGEESQALLI